jgi:hypothetical protein
MQNLLNELTELLSKDKRLVSEGKLLKNKVIELALAVDSGFIKLLLQSKSIKKHFFTDIDGVLVFDKIAFQKFVSNKEFLPESYTAFKNKLGLVNENGDYLSKSREVVLAWPYKDCVLEGGQTKEDQKRDEIFWNETLAPDEIDRLFAPKVLSNFKKYDKKGVIELTGKEQFNIYDENLLIRGNNLLGLHSLPKKFFGNIKLIYIDPPYNTGNDEFLYNDTFNHSTWLTFIKNRLEIAHELLCKEGAIFISIDDYLSEVKGYYSISKCKKCGRDFACEEIKKPLIKKVSTYDGYEETETRYFKCKYCNEEDLKIKSLLKSSKSRRREYAKKGETCKGCGKKFSLIEYRYPDTHLEDLNVERTTKHYKCTHCGYMEISIQDKTVYTD